VDDTDYDYDLAIALSLSLTANNQGEEPNNSISIQEIEKIEVESHDEFYHRSESDEELQLVLELSRKEAKKAICQSSIQENQLVSSRTVGLTGFERSFCIITWPTMKEFTELYGTCYDGFLVLPPGTLIEIPDSNMPEDHITLYKQLENEVQTEYDAWSFPPLNINKWYNKAVTSFKKKMRSQRDYDGKSHPYKLPKIVETKLLSERRLVRALPVSQSSIHVLRHSAYGAINGTLV